MKVIVTQYLVLTTEEIQLWQEDSLKFFLHMKNLSNEVKGNYLRDKAKSLIAGIQLRFSQHLETFCTFIIAQLVSHNDLSQKGQIEKEAML